jgi:hypothetical protein
MQWPRAAGWTPPPLDAKALVGGFEKLRAAVTGILQVKADALLAGFEAAVVAALKDTVLAPPGEAGQLATGGDIESGGSMVEELSEAVLWGLVEGARRLLSKRLGPLLREAADAVAVAADLRLVTAQKLRAVSDAAKAAEADAAEEEADALLPVAKRLDTIVEDVKDRLQIVQEALGKVLNGSLDKKISATLRVFGSSLMDKRSGGVKQLGALRTKAETLERQIKKTLAGSPAAIGALAVALRPAFDVAVGGKDASMNGDAFKAFAEAVHLEADETQLMKWYKEMGGKTSNTDSDVTFHALETWLVSQKSDAPDAIVNWICERRGVAKFLPKGALGLQLCKDRIKTALSGVTSYSKAGYCKQLCRVVTTSRDQLTTHENELAYVSLHRPTAYMCADRALTSLQPARYLQETLHELAQNAPTALNWLDFFGSFQAMLQA